MADVLDLSNVRYASDNPRGGDTPPAAEPWIYRLAEGPALPWATRFGCTPMPCSPIPG